MVVSACGVEEVASCNAGIFGDRLPSTRTRAFETIQTTFASSYNDSAAVTNNQIIRGPLAAMDTPAPRLSLFSLPLEVRNQIYHHIFTAEPYLAAEFNREEYMYTHYSTRCCGINEPNELLSKPIWLLTCRTLMHEALAQYSLHASWVMAYYFEFKGWRSHKLPLDKSKIRTLEVHVGFLLEWTVSCRAPSEDPRHPVEVLTWEIEEAGVTFDRIRFQGYHREVEKMDTEEYPASQTAQVFKEMRDMFQGLGVQEWFLEVSPMEEEYKTELVYQFIGGEVVLVEDGRAAPFKKAGVDGRVHTELCRDYRQKISQRLIDRLK